MNAEIGVLYIFWVILGCDTHLERIVLKTIEINKDRLRTKFSAFNVDFDGLSLNFLGSRKPAPDGIKEQYPRKSYFTVVG